MVILAVILIIVSIIMLLDRSNVEINENQITYTSSFIRGANLFFPEKLIFSKDRVTLIRNHGSKELYTSESKQTIPHHKITGINVVRNLIGCNIEIVGDGFQSIYARSYSSGYADQIEEMVNVILEDK